MNPTGSENEQCHFPEPVSFSLPAVGVERLMPRFPKYAALWGKAGNVMRRFAPARDSHRSRTIKFWGPSNIQKMGTRPPHFFTNNAPLFAASKRPYAAHHNGHALVSRFSSITRPKPSSLPPASSVSEQMANEELRVRTPRNSPKTPRVKLAS